MKTLIFLILIILSGYSFSQSDVWHLIQGEKYVNGLNTNCENTWICTDDAIICYNTISNAKTIYNATNSNFKGSSTQIDFDKEGNKWIAGDSGLFKIDENSISAIDIRCFDTNYTYSQNLQNIKVDFDGAIWFTGTFNGLYKYQPDTKICERISFENNSKKYFLTSDANGIIYFANYSGGKVRVYQYNGNINLFAESDSVTFANKEINSFVVDALGTVWIAFDVGSAYGKDEYIILNGGILTYTHGEWKAFTSQDLNGLDSCGFINIYTDISNNIIVQQNRGFLESSWIVKTLNISYNYLTMTTEIIETPFEDITQKLVHIDNENKLYFKNFTSVFTKNGLEETIYTTDYPDFVNSYITCDTKGNIWLTSSKNLIKLTGDEMVIIDSLPINTEDDYPKSIYADPNDHIWINYGSFFLEYDLTNWLYHPKSWFGLEEVFDNFISYQVDNNGNAWVITKHKLLKNNGMGWEQITIPLLDEDEELSLLAVGNPDVFIRAESGIFHYNGVNWVTYNSNTSTLEDYISISHMTVDTNNTLYFGGYDGLYKLDENSLTLISDLNVRGLIGDKISNLIWFIGGNELYKVIDSDIHAAFNLPDRKYNNFYHISNDENSNIVLLGDQLYSDLQIFNEDGLVGYENYISYSANIPPSYCKQPSVTEVDLKIFPNPSSDLLLLEYYLPASIETQIDFFNVQGQLIKSIDMENNVYGDQLISINISDFSNGMYLIAIKGEGLNLTSKFLKF